MRQIPLKAGLGVRALTSTPLSAQIGCAPCKAMARQKEANEEFARRYGVVRDPRQAEEERGNK